MKSFSAYAESVVAFLKIKLEEMEGFFLPLAKSAIDAGLHDLSGDALQIAAQVAADPTIVTDAAKRDAIATALGAKIVDQGKTLGENEIHAFAAAALAQAQAAQAGGTAPTSGTMPPAPLTAAKVG